jgi:hypothetical protein
MICQHRACSAELDYWATRTQYFSATASFKYPAISLAGRLDKYGLLFRRLKISNPKTKTQVGDRMITYQLISGGARQRMTQE